MNAKKKLELILPICIIFFFIISIMSIFSSSNILSSNYNGLYIKQIMWYILSIGVFLGILFLGNDRILRYSNFFYIFSISLLILVLLFGKTINNTTGWFNLGLFNFQPSEFVKLSLILFLSKILNDYHFSENKTWKKELLTIFKILLYTFIPSLLVFAQPDTGAVISYLVIALSMIFISEIRFRWFLSLIVFIFIMIGIVGIVYIKFPQIFVDFFGNNIYYRIFRIIDWKNSSGMQLENSLIVIGTSGIFGHNFNNIPIYFPEPYTDFIFSVHASNFGVLGAIILIFIILIFDFKILIAALKTSKTFDKYIIFGILTSFVYPQIQNIAMTLGLLPITGITLPFISYGGSSLIISFIMIGLVINSNK